MAPTVTFDTIYNELATMSNEQLIILSREANKPSFDDASPMRQLIIKLYGEFSLMYILAILPVLCYRMADVLENV